MSDTPVWLLDVDGVLNATKPKWHAAPRRAIACADGSEWEIRWAPALARRIRRLHHAGVVEIIWATTWCPWAGEIERLLGLPEFYRAWPDVKFGWEAQEAKRSAARDLIAQGRRLIWTDDEVVPLVGPPRRELTADGLALLIRPAARHGLTPEDMDYIERFCGLSAVVAA